MVIGIDCAIWNTSYEHTKCISVGDYFRLLNIFHRWEAFDACGEEAMVAKPIRVKSIKLKLPQNFRGRNVRSKVSFMIFSVCFNLTSLSCDGKVNSRYLHKFSIRSFSSIEQAKCRLQFWWTCVLRTLIVNS